MSRDIRRDRIARAIHESRIALAWGKQAIGVRDPWPAAGAPLPGDFGYEPCSWVDFAFAAADAALRVITHG